MNLVIIGSGLAGCIAYGATSSMNPTIYDSKSGDKPLLSDHYAVMRMRNPDIAKYLGCSVETVNVYKAVYSDSRLHNECAIDMMNSYSKKVYGSLGVRSIFNLGIVKRYLISGISNPTSVKYLHNLYSIGDKTAKFVYTRSATNKLDRHAGYDFCISTIPLPILLRICKIEYPEHLFKYKKIHVYNFKIGIPSSVHQTIYFPDPEHDVYRATLECDKMIVECGAEWKDFSSDAVMRAFGLSTVNVGKVSYNVQPFGKISCYDHDLRRSFIQQLTERFGVYSFGRYATWRPLRADQLMDDIEKIKRLIGASEQRRRYETKLMEV